MKKIKVVNQSGQFVAEFDTLEKAQSYLADKPQFVLEDDYRPSDAKAITSTLKVGGTIAMVFCLLVGGCIVAGSNDSRDPLQKALDARQVKCNSAKWSGSAVNQYNYCN